MKPKYIKLIAGVTALALSGSFTIWYAGTKDTKDIYATSGTSDDIISTPAPVKTESSLTLSKSETVYVNASSSGKADSVTVSDWLKNPAAAGVIEDVSMLDDIKNIKGDEQFTDNDGILKWEADGADIYYQGTASDELPVTMNVSYYLDGEKMPAGALAGKSGKVTMRFDYTNNQQTQINVDGKSYTVSVPFLVATGMVLDSSKFTNVEVKNGKVVSDGNSCFVLGGALPGLSESLDLDSFSSDDIKLDIDIPDYFEVTADVVDFSIETTVTVITNELFNELDFDAKSTINDLKDTISELSDASKQLVDGSSELYDGLEELFKKSGEMTDGIDKLKDGADKLNSAVGTLDDGTKKLYSGTEELKNGGQTLNSGAGELSKGTASLSEGAKGLKDGSSRLTEGSGSLADASVSLKNGAVQLDEGMLSLKGGITQVNSGLFKLTENTPVLKGGSAKFYAGLKQVKESLDNVKSDTTQIAQLTEASSKIKEGIQVLNKGAAQLQQNVSSAAMKKAFLQKGLDTDALAEGNKECIDALSSQIEQLQTQLKQIAGVAGYEEQAKQLQAQLESLGKVVTVLKGDSAYITASQTYIDTLAAAVEQLSAGLAQLDKNYAEFDKAIQTLVSKLGETTESISKLKGAINQLAESYAAIDSGIGSYTEGVQSLFDGSKELVSGVDKLSAGAASLSDGTTKLSAGASTLYDGVKELSAGAGTLCDGAGALNAGAQSLKSGSDTLLSGINTLYTSVGTLKNGAASLSGGTSQLSEGLKNLQDGGKALVDGVGKLKDGSEKLKDGMSDFDKKGIQKISDIVNKDMATLTDRIQAISDASKSYKSYSGISDSMDGSVKFIIETAKIGE